MAALVNIFVWFFLSIIGVAMTATLGGEAGSLKRINTIPNIIKILFILTLIWLITVIFLSFTYSKWYLLSIFISLGYLFICYSGTSKANTSDGAFLTDENNSEGPSMDNQMLRLQFEQYVNDYEKILTTRKDKNEFMPESILPGSKEDMATALSFIYHFRLLEFTPKYSVEELTERYYFLAHFIPDDDAYFMNDFIGLMSRDEEAVVFVTNNPYQFIVNKKRMDSIYSYVNKKTTALDEWWNALFDDEETE